MITEVVQAEGSWEVSLTATVPYSYWNELELFGHIVITAQEIDPLSHTRDDVLAMARYVGPMLKKNVTNGGFQLGGAGMVWWLGSSDSVGPILETKVELSASTIDNALTSILPDSIIKGTITETGTTYTGTFHWDSSLEALRTLCASTGAEFRVNNDGTIDVGGPGDLYPTYTSPTVVVTRSQGSDPIYKAIVTPEMNFDFDGTEYVSRVVVTATDSDNVETLVAPQNQPFAPTQTDIHGNAFSRTAKINVGGGAVDTTTYSTAQLNERSFIATINVSTVFEEMVQGDLFVGDTFYGWDPPALVDTDNEIFFRGEYINPYKLRLLSASWPLTEGMGVYYLSPSATTSWLDLTKYVAWEQDSGSIRGS